MLSVQDEENEVLQRCVWKPHRIDALGGIKIDQVTFGRNHDWLAQHPLFVVCLNADSCGAN